MKAHFYPILFIEKLCSIRETSRYKKKLSRIFSSKYDFFFGKKIFDITRYITGFIAIYVMQRSEVTKKIGLIGAKVKYVACTYIHSTGANHLLL